CSIISSSITVLSRVVRSAIVHSLAQKHVFVGRLNPVFANLGAQSLRGARQRGFLVRFVFVIERFEPHGSRDSGTIRARAAACPKSFGETPGFRPAPARLPPRPGWVPFER